MNIPRIQMTRKHWGVVLMAVVLVGGFTIIGSGMMMNQFYTATEGVWQFTPYLDTIYYMGEDSVTHVYQTEADVKSEDPDATIYAWGAFKRSFDPDGHIYHTKHTIYSVYTYVGEAKAPGITVEIDALQHVDTDGDPLPETEPTLPDQVGIGGYTHRYFWYDFHVLFRTNAKQACPEINWQPDAEAEAVELRVFIGLRLQKSIFDNNVSAKIVGADIIDIEHRLTGGAFSDMTVDSDELAELAADWRSPKYAPEAESHVSTGQLSPFVLTNSSEVKDVYFEVSLRMRSGFETLWGGFLGLTPVGLNIYDVQTMYTIRAKLAVLIPPVMDPDPQELEFYEDLYIPLDDDFKSWEFFEMLSEMFLIIVIVIVIVVAVFVVIYLMLKRKGIV